MQPVSVYRPKSSPPALFIPADLPESDHRWSSRLPAWLTESASFRQNLDAAAVREGLMQGYAQAYAKGDQEGMLLARLYDLRYFNHRPGDLAFKKAEEGLTNFSHPALHAFHAVALAMAHVEQDKEDLARAGEILLRALEFACQARDALIDTVVGDAIGDFNQLAGHFDAAERAYRFAYRKGNGFVTTEVAGILLALNLSMINVGRRQFLEARQHLESVRAKIPTQPVRIKNFATWLGFICGDETTVGKVNLDISSDDLLRQELRRRFLRGDQAVHSADIAGTIDLIQAARLDPLTRLPTGAAIRSALHRALDMNRAPTLMLIEVADFAGVASVLGEQQCDRLVISIARRLDTALGKRFTLGRVGFARFAAVTLEDAEFIEASISRAQRSLAEPFGEEQHKLHLTTHFVVARPKDDDTGYDLWARSITALNKRRNDGQDAMYLEALQSPSQTRSFKMVQALHQGGPGRTPHCEFQPIVDTRTGTMAGCEALARWNSEEFGTVSPGEFISLIEQAGLSVRIGRELARQAIARGARFLQIDPAFKLHFNMSVAEFSASDTPQFLEQTLQELGMPATAFGLEITESALLDTSETTVRRIQELNAKGISCLLDDFGTGYSNLSYITDLPRLDLKIDGSFIRKGQQSRPAAMVCLMLIQLAKGLNISVVAEQVETLEQARWLNGLGCFLHQGWYYSKAVPGDTLEALMIDPPEHWRTAPGNTPARGTKTKKAQDELSRAFSGF